MYLCRLCLKKSEFRFSLFTGNILQKIESLTSIKITADDKLPHTCCESCMASVYSAYKFQQCMVEADKTLRKLIKENSKIFENIDDIKLEINEQTEDVECKIEPLSLADDCEDPLYDYNGIKNSPSSTLDISDVVMLDDKSGESEDVKINTSLSEISNNYEISKTDDSSTKEQFENVEIGCGECSEKFNTKRLLQQHMAKHRVDTCPFCNIIMRRDNLKKHIQIHSESPEICEICGKVAKNKESLRGHINYQHKRKAKIKCEQCGKEFKSTHHYNSHVRNVHLGIRNHQCHICGKKFFSNHDLNKHINMTHKRSRPYICQYCKKGFSSPYARKTHIRQHTLETPYRCDICTAGFRQKVSLVTHMKSKHPNNQTLIECVAIE